MFPAARHVISLLCVLLPGCTAQQWPSRAEPPEVKVPVKPQEPQVWHGDISWSPEDRAIIEESNQWVATHTGTRKVPIVWDLEPEADVFSVGWAIIKGKAGGGMSNIGNHSTTFTDLGNPLGAISAHEFGHLVGLDHTPDPLSFMYFAPEFRDWTDTDEVYCVSSGVCATAPR